MKYEQEKALNDLIMSQRDVFTVDSILDLVFDKFVNFFESKDSCKEYLRVKLSRMNKSEFLLSNGYEYSTK